jgi:hypothetical protein
MEGEENNCCLNDTIADEITELLGRKLTGKILHFE